MARVPITVMGFRCERCGHEWIPRSERDQEPRVCPKCKSSYWNLPPKKANSATSYENFRDRIVKVLKSHTEGATWTEIRTEARLPQAFPNNTWVKRLEEEIGLERTREDGVLHWRLNWGS